jgi:hypothetical protein
VIHVDDDGHISRFVRASIQGDEYVAPEIFSNTSSLHGPWHPVEKILDLFLGIDRLVLRSYLIASVKYLQQIERKIQKDALQNSLRDTTMSLVSLNINLSKLRTTLQYLHTSVAVLKLNTPELETPRHRELLLENLKSQDAEYWGWAAPDNLIHAARPDRTKLRIRVEEEFDKADWYHPGLHYRLEHLDMILVQRLLDVDSVQQRIDISLSAVSSP